MKKLLLAITAIAMLSSVATAETFTRKATITSVSPVYESVFIDKPYTRCDNVKVPVYGTRQRDGNAAGSALLGMIIGGAVGKGLTGKDDGAAVGAVMGGLIGADQGSKPKTENVIIGYEDKRQCYETIKQEKAQKITGYEITYKWSGLSGSFYSSSKLVIGDTVKININMAVNNY